MAELELRKLKLGKVGATALSGIQVYRPTINPASVAANTVAAESFTVTGLETSDTVEVNAGIDTIGIGNVRVSAKDTLRVTFINPTGGAIDPASSTWLVKATRS